MTKRELSALGALYKHWPGRLHVELLPMGVGPRTIDALVARGYAVRTGVWLKLLDPGRYAWNDHRLRRQTG